MGTTETLTRRGQVLIRGTAGQTIVRVPGAGVEGHSGFSASGPLGGYTLQDLIIAGTGLGSNGVEAGLGAYIVVDRIELRGPMLRGLVIDGGVLAVGSVTLSGEFQAWLLVRNGNAYVSNGTITANPGTRFSWVGVVADRGAMVSFSGVTVTGAASAVGPRWRADTNAVIEEGRDALPGNGPGQLGPGGLHY